MLVNQLDERSLDKLYEYVETLAEAQMLKNANHLIIPPKLIEFYFRITIR